MRRADYLGDLRYVIVAFALVLLTLFWVVAYSYVRDERIRHVEQVILANGNLARAFEEHTLRTIKGIDQIVLDVRAQYLKTGRRLDLRKLFRESELNPGLIKAVLVFDERGNLVAGNIEFGNVNVRDREHFLVHLARDSGRLHVGQPIRGRTTGAWQIPMTRRITRLDGSFGGTIYVGVDPFYFSNFYRTIDLGKYGVVTLFGLDGFVRARLSGLNADVGQDVRKAEIFRALERSAQGSITFTAVIDKITRIYSYRAMAEYPIAVAVGVAESEALASSDRLARNVYLVAGGVTILLLGFGIWLLAHAVGQRRTLAALSRSNAELSDALDALRRTQEELLRSEKLAALGRLVAGVAHELNTPIGNTLLMVSMLGDRVRAFADLCGTGPLQESQVGKFNADIQDAVRHAMTNITRAAELIATFKQVAVDQTSSQRRPFDLAEMIDDVLDTLSPLLKRKPYVLNRHLAPGVTMESYPGPLGQVITNLIHNALLHAFDGRKVGTMSIESRMVGDAAVIVFTDDGVGIGEEDMRRIFDPFFTTKRSAGGSGLGLHIVHNIVTSVLGGRIEASSYLGRGARFIITIPRHAPEVDARSSRVLAHDLPVASNTPFKEKT